MPLSRESGSRSVILGFGSEFLSHIVPESNTNCKSRVCFKLWSPILSSRTCILSLPFFFLIYASPFPRPSPGLWAQPLHVPCSLQTPWSCHSTLSCSSHISSDFPHSRNPILPLAYPYRLTVSGTQEVWNKQLCLTSSPGNWLGARGGFSHTVKAHGLRRDVRITGKLWKEEERILTRAETTPQTWQFKGRFWSQVVWCRAVSCVQGHLWLRRAFEASLDHVRQCLKISK